MFHYGAAYYPEQETPEDIESDIPHDARIGFNAMRHRRIRLGEI